MIGVKKYNIKSIEVIFVIYALIVYYFQSTWYSKHYRNTGIYLAIIMSRIQPETESNLSPLMKYLVASKI